MDEESIYAEENGADAEGDAPAAEPAPEENARERDFVEFIRRYPHVKAEEIPARVWARVRRGEKLVNAYAGYENEELRRENMGLTERLAMSEQSRVNRERSAGSQLSAGRGRTMSDWERVWYED